MRQILLYLFILMACGVNAEQFRITGTVVDAGDNEPLIGVGVQIKGTDRGTATDFDGNFCIDIIIFNNQDMTAADIICFLFFF